MEFRAELINEITEIISQARERVIRYMNTARLLMYWRLGKKISEEEW